MTSKSIIAKNRGVKMEKGSIKQVHEAVAHGGGVNCYRGRPISNERPSAIPHDRCW